MSIYAQVDDNQTQVASNTGWGEFTRWVDGLDVDANESLIHLADYGWTENISDAAAQLDAALAASPPSDDKVLSTAKVLLQALQAGGSVATITDGMTKDTDAS